MVFVEPFDVEEDDAWEARLEQQRTFDRRKTPGLARFERTEPVILRNDFGRRED